MLRYQCCHRSVVLRINLLNFCRVNTFKQFGTTCTKALLTCSLTHILQLLLWTMRCSYRLPVLCYVDNTTKPPWWATQLTRLSILSSYTTKFGFFFSFKGSSQGMDSKPSQPPARPDSQYNQSPSHQPAANTGGGFLSSLKGSAGHFMKNIKDASTKVAHTVSQTVS